MIVYGQSVNKSGLIKTLNEYNDFRTQMNQETQEYLIQGNTIISADHIYFQYVKDGLPYYSGLHNIQARKTTGVHTVQERYSDMDLTGNGIKVGVWDGGLVLTDHVEFQNRVTNKVGTSFSNHATHVTGTIAASGVNADAMGMVPEVSVDSYFAFDDDISTITSAAGEGLILSNHSYGLLLGWEFDDGEWRWFGGADDVDLRFGTYTNSSRVLDEIAFNAPYYTMVRSAGNDRSDVGDGSRPPDGPFDTIGPAAGAKNVITVGAITGFDEYTGVDDAVISSFSSYGPTNDGRIKPDLVGDGVGVLSTSSQGANAYTTLQGTSMSAPNVTGSLAVIQNYVQNNADSVLLSSTLKALAIHTAHEAGSADGPDYVFGWGVLNTLGAIELLEHVNNNDTLILVNSLNNGGTFNLKFLSNGNSPIKFTLAWTDPAGVAHSAGGMEKSLVNDLDIRLTDDEGNIYYPFTLNPAQPSQGAQRGDNNTDNVEQLFVVNADPGEYTLEINHKGTLTNDRQKFSLIGTFGSLSSEQVYYNRLGEGIFDEADRWSLTSGGVPEIDPQLDSSTLVLNDLSELSNLDTISLNGNLTLENLIVKTEKSIVLDMNQDTLKVYGQVFFENDVSIVNGAIQLIDQQNINLANVTGKATLLVSGDLVTSSYAIKFDEIILENGLFIFEELEIESSRLIINDGTTANFNSCNFTLADFSNLSNNVSISGGSFTFSGGQLNGGDVITTIDNGEINFQGTYSVLGSFSFPSVTINDHISIDGDITVTSLGLLGNSVIELVDNSVLTIDSSLNIFSSVDNPVSLTGTSENNLGIINIGFRELLCYDHINVTNVNVQSESVFNISDSGILVNSQNVSQGACGEILFPDFTALSECTNQLVIIKNESLGSYQNVNWNIESADGYEVIFSSPDSIGVRISEVGNTTVRVTIDNEVSSSFFEDNLNLIENGLSNIEIVEVSDGLASSIVANNYRWYFDGVLLLNETERIVVPDQSGIYHLEYFSSENETCNSRLSQGYSVNVITSIDDIASSQMDNFTIYPNPTDNKLNISGDKPVLSMILVDANGKQHKTKMVINADGGYSFDLSNLNKGLYQLIILTREKNIYKKIIKK